MAIRGWRQRRGPEEDVMASWRGVCVGVLTYVRASLSRDGGVCVVPTLHVESMPACVCACVGGGRGKRRVLVNVNEWVAAVALRMCGWSGGWPGPNLFFPASMGRSRRSVTGMRRRSLLHKEQRVR